GIEADMGGTEIYRALEAVFEMSKKSEDSNVKNLSIFVLTDGQVWNESDVFNVIRQQVNSTQDSNSSGKITRVFTLGIGSGVSHQLVEGMARVGKGYAQFVQEDERMEKKVIGMLKNALLPPLTDYEV